MADHSDTTHADKRIPYIGPLYPITFEDYERLNDEQHHLHVWACRFVADSNDALTDLLFASGVLP